MEKGMMTETQVRQLLLEQYGFGSAQLEQLTEYLRQLVAYNQRYNLVAASTLGDVWFRHVLDSAQLLTYITPQADRPVSLLDLGSGAGFPGLVLAIGLASRAEVTLVEKSYRKAEFLQQVVKDLGLSVKICQQPLAEVPAQAMDYIIARAFAPLRELLLHSRPFLQPHTKCLFLKGQKYLLEIREAESRLSPFNLELFPSQTSTDSRVLVLQLA